jgi:hypothetical protein
MAHVPEIIVSVSARINVGDTPTPVHLYTPKETTLFRVTGYISTATASGFIAFSWNDPTTGAPVGIGVGIGPDGPPTGSSKIFLSPPVEISYMLVWSSGVGTEPFDAIIVLEALT